MTKIFDCQQGSDEWRKVHAGIPSASEFHSILAQGQGKTRRSYMNRLAAEVISGEMAETYSNSHMERGKAMEAEARAAYALMSDADLTQVGFVLDEATNAGCSPDSLIGTDGALEIKTKLPALLIECIRNNEVPSEHKAQLQGTLWVTEREWIDLAIYWPKLPLFRQRVTRDKPYIAALASEVARFNEELQAVVAMIRRYK